MLKQLYKGETGCGRMFSHNYFEHGGSSRKWAFEEPPTLVTLTVLKILFLVMWWESGVSITMVQLCPRDNSKYRTFFSKFITCYTKTYLMNSSSLNLFMKISDLLSLAQASMWINVCIVFRSLFKIISCPLNNKIKNKNWLSKLCMISFFHISRAFKSQALEAIFYQGEPVMHPLKVHTLQTKLIIFSETAYVLTHLVSNAFIWQICANFQTPNNSEDRNAFGYK